MYLFRVFIVGLCLTMLLAACAIAPGKKDARVNCPACGHEFDAFYQKRF